MRILSGSVTSPTLAAQIAGLRQRFPELRCTGGRRIGATRPVKVPFLAFGRRVDTVLHVERANVILAIESDFLDAAPGHLVYARDFAKRRRAAEEGEAAGMNRLYAVESVPTLAGARADHRFVAHPDEIEAAVRALAAELGVGAGGVAGGGAGVGGGCRSRSGT